MNLVGMLPAAGVDGHSADSYPASLELGEATAATTSRSARIGRMNVYEVLDSILAMELVQPSRKVRAATSSRKIPSRFFGESSVSGRWCRMCCRTFVCRTTRRVANTEFAPLSASTASRQFLVRWSSQVKERRAIMSNANSSR